jgi:hypothetical protein
LLAIALRDIVAVMRSWFAAVLGLSSWAACNTDSTLKDTAPKVTGRDIGQKTNAPKIPPPDKPLPGLARDGGKSTGKPMWGVGLGGLGSDAPRAIAVDGKGNTVVVGTFDGEFEVGDIKKKSHGGSDAFVVMLDPSGKPLWVQTFGALREDNANAVLIKGDQIVVAGSFLDEITIGEFHHRSAGSDDLFVAAFDLKGEPQWLFTSGGVDSDGANSIAATPDGGFVIGGSFRGEAKFGDTILHAKGGEDGLLLKLDKSLTVSWVKQFGGNYNDMVRSLAVDAQGSIYLQGIFAYRGDWSGVCEPRRCMDGTVATDRDPKVCKEDAGLAKPPPPEKCQGELIANGNSGNDIVLAKYDANGDYKWGKRYGGDFDDVAGAIAVDPSGHIMMTGAFDRTASFGEGDSHTSAGESDIFVGRFTTDGKLEWVKTFGNKREDIGWSIAVDASGNSVTTGWFQSSVDFGKGELASKGNKDVFALKLDAQGNTLWATSWGDHDHDQGRGVALDDKGNPTFTGIFRFTLDAVTPALESRRAPEDRLPMADVYVIRLER